MANQHGTYGSVGNGTMVDCSESSEVLFEASEMGASKETRPLLQRKFEEKKDGACVAMHGRAHGRTRYVDVGTANVSGDFSFQETCLLFF